MMEVCIAEGGRVAFFSGSFVNKLTTELHKEQNEGFEILHHDCTKNFALKDNVFQGECIIFISLIRIYLQ